MPDQNTEKEFDALTVPLKGSNLIEASAGTGKTYSISILVLRLILENQFSIKEILMVTFTKAAVAELEERIRLFVRNAYRVSKGEKISDETVTSLVQQSIKKNGAEEVNALLKEAILFLDEIAVVTIHSFCQKTLNEFAFETNQLFSAELITDISPILEDEVHKFWRKNITTIEPDLLAILMKNCLNQSTITSVVKEHLNGKSYYGYESEKEYTFSEKEQLTFLNELKEIKIRETEISQSVHQHIQNERETISSLCARNRYAKTSLLPFVNDSEQFIEQLNIIKKKKSRYIFELFPDVTEKCEEIEEVTEVFKEAIKKCFNQIYFLAINEISEGIKKCKLYSNQLSFDDLIANLNKEIVRRSNPQLVKALQETYKAVFIDEFQDTDRMQYEIFKTAFGKNTVLFYIGDPKQSIYAWRKADIFTYFKAKSDVDTIYKMNINFRSTAVFIEAMNQFFLPDEHFDTFHFGEAKDSIKYVPVESPKKNNKGLLKSGQCQVIPITMNSEFKKKEDIANAVSKQVAELLSDKEYAIFGNGQSRKIKPSDIGILVRNHGDGEKVKNALATFNIPAVSISNQKVLQSNEAKEILHVLEAMVDNRRENINKAILTSFTGYSIADILALDEEKTSNLFKQYKGSWEKNGVYASLVNFISDFEIQRKLLSGHSENGERIITNLYQLLELLYKNESIKNLLPFELIDWLKRGIEQGDAEADELEQRIENDEEAVKIVTIHSSKGLQYNIVLCPYLDFVENTKQEMCSFRDNETGDYISAKKSQLSPEQQIELENQNEQENRRLLYVAVTRAIYKCYIYRNNYYKKSTLTYFTDNLLNANPQFIEWGNTPEIPENYSYNRQQEHAIKREIQPVHFRLQHADWRRVSYSMLTAESERIRKNKFNYSDEDYDFFIFNQLTKGTITGNMLHFIFENLYFNNDEKWSLVIEKAIKRFAPAQKEKYETGLIKMLQNVLNATIPVGDFSFQLREIDFENRLHELEFDFPVSPFNPSLLENFSNKNREVSVKIWSELEGVMNGKIDLFFEHSEKYFVLDWKSTFLGGSLDDYSQTALTQAMNENNYHLQYLIYALAVKKYLQSRLPAFNYERDFGGVIYCFVRGMREGSNSGIFWTKPDMEEIEKLEELVCAM